MERKNNSWREYDKLLKRDRKTSFNAVGFVKVITLRINSVMQSPFHFDVNTHYILITCVVGKDNNN